MSLANPMSLLWLLLVIPVVIFYILKIRLKRVPVSTVIFWRQIFDEKKPRSLWQRLRHLVSLLCQIALVLLLVAALTEPFFSWEANNARRVILVLDNSASMNAAEDDTTRLALAKEQANDVIRGLRHLDEMAVVAAGTLPRVACGLTGHQKTLRKAIETIEPSEGPTRLNEAIALARRLATDTAGSHECRIVVVTDACVEDAAKLTIGDDIRIVRIGSIMSNVGITRFQVRRSTIDPLGYEALLEVTNQSDEPTGDFRLVISLNGSTVDVKSLKLAANAKWSEVIESATADGGLLTAELVVKGEKKEEPYPDSLAADNKAFAILPKRDPTPVHMHSPGGNLFLQKVLEANPLVQLTTSKEMPKEYPAGSVKVFHREVPAKLPPGPVLVVDPTNDCELWKVGDKLQSPIVTQQDKESPFMAHVRLDNVILPESRKMTFASGVKPHVLAGAVTGDPLFTLIERPEGKVVVLTVNLDLGDLPFRTAFPILAMNTLGVFTGGSGEIRESLATGATAEATLPNSTTEYQLRAPDGTRRVLPTGSAKVTLGPFDRCGVWDIVTTESNAEPVEQFAVNLMSQSESDLRPREGIAAVSSAAEAGLVGGFFGRPVWWFLIAVAAVFATVEWYLYQRRWIS